MGLDKDTRKQTRDWVQSEQADRPSGESEELASPNRSTVARTADRGDAAIDKSHWRSSRHAKNKQRANEVLQKRAVGASTASFQSTSARDDSKSAYRADQRKHLAEERLQRRRTDRETEKAERSVVPSKQSPTRHKKKRKVLREEDAHDVESAHFPDSQSTAGDDDVVTSTPGAIRVKGIGFDGDRQVPSGSFELQKSEDNDHSRHLAEQRASIAKAINVSHEDLVQEYREQILREVIYATDVEVTQGPKSFLNCRKTVFVVVVAVTLTFLVGVVAVVLIHGSGSSSTDSALNSSDSSTMMDSPTKAPSRSSLEHAWENEEVQAFYERLYGNLHEGGEQLDDSNSAYAVVFNRMINDPTISLRGKEAAYRFYLTVFFETTQGSQWLDNTNWNTSVSYCEWHGVTCQSEFRHRRMQSHSDDDGGGKNQLEDVAFLELSGNNLQGPILPELGLMHWTRLDLGNNMLTGTIPEQLGKLKDLTLFHSAGNEMLGGEVPFCRGNSQESEPGQVIKVDCGNVECRCCTPACER